MNYCWESPNCQDVIHKGRYVTGMKTEELVQVVKFEALNSTLKNFDKNKARSH